MKRRKLMESKSKAQEYKTQFDNYQITQNEIPEELKPEIANLYSKEIDNIRKHIKDLNAQINTYQRKIDALKNSK